MEHRHHRSWFPCPCDPPPEGASSRKALQVISSCAIGGGGWTGEDVSLRGVFHVAVRRSGSELNRTPPPCGPFQMR